MKKLVSVVLFALSVASVSHAFLIPGLPDVPSRYPGYPGQNDVYGPARTVRWQDMGSFTAQKIIETTVRLDVRGQYVNEVFAVTRDNEVQISSAVAYLSNGDTLDLRYLTGVIRKGQQVRIPLDYRNSLRVDSIELRIESSNLIGSRGSLMLHLGLAF